MAAEYYKTGPQQGTPPDGTLEAGTKVRVVGDQGSYVRVVTEGGIECSVAANALRKLGEKRDQDAEEEQSDSRSD